MRINVLLVAILAVTAVVAAFLIFRDAPAPAGTENSAGTLSHVNAPPSGESKSISPVTVGPDINQNNQQADVDSDSISPELQETYAEVSHNPDYPQLQTRLDALHKRHSGKSFDAGKVIETLAQPAAWNRISEVPEELPLKPAEQFDGREFIHFNPARIEVMMPGDTLEIPVWQLGERFTMLVDRTETHSNGSVTWHGHLENFDESHRVTITVGEGIGLGGIDTPNGHYVLQANGDKGWIASSETLFKRNEAETDMIIPPGGEPE